MDSKLDKELKDGFKKAFDKKALDRNFYNKLNYRLEEEKANEKKFINRIKKGLDREVEIDIKGLIVAASIMITVPTIFSIKEITPEYRERVNVKFEIEKK